MTRALALLLATGCLGDTGKADLGQHDPDSATCGACEHAPLAPSEGMADAQCMAPREPVVDPFQLGVKTELFVPGATSYQATHGQPIVVDVDGDGDREIVLYGDAGEDLLLSAFDHGGEVLWTKPARWTNVSLAGANVDGHGGAEIIASTCAGLGRGAAVATDAWIRPSGLRGKPRRGTSFGGRLG